MLTHHPVYVWHGSHHLLSHQCDKSGWISALFWRPQRARSVERLSDNKTKPSAPLRRSRLSLLDKVLAHSETLSFRVDSILRVSLMNAWRHSTNRTHQKRTFFPHGSPDIHKISTFYPGRRGHLINDFGSRVRFLQPAASSGKVLNPRSVNIRLKLHTRKSFEFIGFTCSLPSISFLASH